MLGRHTFIGWANNYGFTTYPDSVLLFNLAEDPNETTDLANDPQNADVLNDLKDRLQCHYDRAVDPWKAEEDLQAGSPANTDPQVSFTGWCESRFTIPIG